MTQKRKRSHEEALRQVEQEMKRRRIDYTSKEWDVSSFNASSSPDNNAFNICKKILEEMRHLPEVSPFIKIDEKAGWYGDYKRRIRKVMDFEKLSRNLRASTYKTVHEFAADMRLIWDNAMKYNPPNTLYWPAAYRFLNHFDRNFNDRIRTLYPREVLHFVFEEVADWLIANDMRGFFVDPVDYVSLKIPLYQTTIKRFFCLKKLKGRVWSYTSEKSFLADMNLIFNNAKQFNPQGSDVHAMAQVLQQKGQKLLQDKLTELKSSHLNRTPQRASNSKHKASNSKHKAQAPSQSSKRPETPVVQDNFQPVTQEQKVWLREHFYQLDEDRLPAIIDKLEPFCEKTDGDDPEIDLEDLPPKVLKSTYDYVKDSLKAQEEINKGAGII